MSKDGLAQALEDSIVRLRAGASLEECLAAYPKLDKQLRPLLSAASRLQVSVPERLPQDARLLARGRIMAAIGREAAARRESRRPRSAFGLGRALLVPTMAVAIVIALFVGLSTSQAPDSAEAATILTVLQGDVRVQGAKSSFAGGSGARLRAGDRVITGSQARAVLTFLDGSTVTLDADTEVLIRSVVDQDGRVRVRLLQVRGSTWTHVPPELGARRIEIDTPTARLEASQASFSTSVGPSGRTEVGAGSGSIQVSSGDRRTEVTGGNRTAVEALGVVGPATAANPPPRELVVRVSGPTFAFLTDPNGATVGLIPPGYAVNQIAGADVSRDAQTITIRIPQPVAGTYVLGLHAAASGSVDVGATVSGISDVASFTVGDGQDWRLKLTLDSQTVALGEPTRQDGSQPSNVTVPSRIIAAATATAAPATPKPQTQTPVPTKTPTKTAATPVPSAATPVRTNDAAR